MTASSWFSAGVTAWDTPSGFVDARNGSTYQAAGTLSYQAGIGYLVELGVDLATHRYTATVTPEGGSPVTIANNYAFRTEHANISSLDTLTLYSMEGTASIGDVTFDD